MLKILVRNSRFAPIVVCDVCGKRIDKAENGAVLFANWPEPAEEYWPDGTHLDFLHSHKGLCFDIAEARMGGREKSGWNELSHHLVYLLRNLAMDRNFFENAVEDAGMVQAIG